jgi:hypothetical protein
MPACILLCGARGRRRRCGHPPLLLCSAQHTARAPLARAAQRALALPGVPLISQEGAAGAPLQDAPLQEVLAGYLAKAEQHRSDMGDKQASVEHLVRAECCVCAYVSVCV